MVETNKSYINKGEDEFLNFPTTNQTKDYVEYILDIQPCPNCGKDMINGKCSDSIICGYGHGENYNEMLRIKKEIKIVEKELLMKEKNKILEAKTLALSTFYVYINKCIINNNDAILYLDIDGEKIKFKTNFKMLETVNGKVVTGIYIRNIKILNKNNRWGKKIISYDIIKQYALGVLSDSRFNKSIISE